MGDGVSARHSPASNVERSIPGLLVAALSYWAMLNVVYTGISGAYTWQRPWQTVPPHGPVEPVAWFVLLDAVAALLASIPVGFVLARWWRGMPDGGLLMVGFGVACWVVLGAFVEFGLPIRPAVRLVALLQFASIGLAPILLFRLAIRLVGRA